jgi:hypothetical protein
VTFISLAALAAAFPPATPAADAPNEKLKSLNERIEALRREYEATPWPADTPQAIGKLLKHDPGACAGFVRRAVRYEPYAGVLRGGRGALATGGGNSADLCLLLHDMIAGASPALQVRFAVADLTEKQVADLVDRASRSAPARPANAATPGAKPAALAPAARQPLPQSPTTTRRQFLADLNVMGAQVEGALKGSLPRPADPRREAIKAARTHVWLQVLVGNEWVSFDAAGGLPLPAAGVRPLDRLPDDWNHTVTLRLEVERVEGGKLVRELLFERRLSAAEWGGRPVEVLILPSELSVMKMIDPAAGNAGNFLEQAKSFKRFATAVSLAGEKPQQGKAFGLDGRVAAAEPAKAGPTGVTAVDPFKRFPVRGGAPAAPDPRPGELAGVWLGVSFASPGSPKATIERPLLDRIGPDARRQKKHAVAGPWKDAKRCAVALLQRYQLLVSTGTVGSVRAGRAALEAALLDQPLLPRAVELEAAPDAKKLQDALTQLTPPSFPSDLIAVNDASLELAQARLMGHGVCYVSRPNLYIRTESLDLLPANLLVSRNTIDVARHELAVLAEPNRVWRTRLLHGLAASELEGRVLDGPAVARSAARRLRAAAGDGLSAVRAARDLDELPVGADAKAVMASELRDGVALLVPAGGKPPVDDAPAAAWWRVTRDGHVTAVGADGRGQAATEGGMILTDVSIPQVKNCMTFVACLNKGVAGGGAMVQTAANCWAEQVKDVAKEVLDNALEQMIGDPFSDLFEGDDDEAAAPEPGTITHLRDAPFQEPDEQNYYELYQQAREELDELKKNMEQVQAAIEDPLGQLPGVAEGRGAADAGAEIGNALGTRVYLLLAMGNDIARFASQPIADPPQPREP